MRIVNGTIFTEGKLIPGLALSFQADTLCGLGAQLPDEETFDATGLTLVPGFIDVHIHGFAGKSANQGEEATRHMARELPKYGTTAFLASLTSGPILNMAKAVEENVQAIRRPEPGAAVLGIHLEGPYFNPVRKGACSVDRIAPVSLEHFQAITGPYASYIKLIAMAPEMPGALDFIDAMVAQGIRIACGHTNATYEQALEAAAHGVTVATHTFNAMSPLAHRAPGMAGAALTCPQLYAEFIGDFIHLHPGAVRLILAAKTNQKAIAITDCTQFGHASPEEIARFTNGRATVIDGAPRLPDGTLAGSCLTLDQSLRNLVHGLGIPLAEALPMYAETAARMLGLTRRGRLAVGCYADIVALDAELRVRAVWAAGRRVV